MTDSVLKNTVNALTNKLLGSDNVLEDLSETDKMLYGEDGDADADTV